MADKLLKSIKFPTLPDRYVIGDASLTEEGAAAEAKAVGDALATKADTKGRYEDLIVGGAEQLMADEYETDKEPYLFRPTGGSADVGNREYLDKIVGGTVAWNQLVGVSDIPSKTSGGITGTNNGDGSYTVNGTATANFDAFKQITSFIVGHKYLLSGCPNGGASDKYYLYLGGKLDYGSGTIWNATQTSSTIDVLVKSGQTVNNLVFKPQITDLTAMFGSTIADYIYSLEQSQAGAGVAWFRNYFPKDYYPYDPGTLRSVEGVSAHEMVGFNQWDEEWEVGSMIPATGEAGTESGRIRSKNHIPVLPNTVYYFKAPSSYTSARILYYDVDKKYLGQADGYFNLTNNATFTTKNNAHYAKFFAVKSDEAYNHDICINLSDPTRNGEYEPYQKHTYPLDSSLTLRGVPKLVDGKLAFDGDVYAPDGTVTRRYGIVDLGTMNWEYIENRDYFRSNSIVNTAKASSLNATPNAECAKYVATSWNALVSGLDKHFTVDNESFVQVKDSAYGTDAATFKTAMSGVYLLYEKATPTTETADGYEQYQICDPSGTEEFVTDSIVPVGHETRYPHDLKKKIETAPDSPSTDGTYLMKRSGGKNAYMALPSTPSANGAYVLTVTVSGGSASYSWAAKE